VSDVSDMTPASDREAAERVEELGFRQELRREFSGFHAFAVSFADTSLIVAFYGVFALALAAAGPTFFWGLLVVLTGQLLVALVLGEVSSTWPLEGGIYQWTREQTGATAGWFAAWAYWWTMVFTMTSVAYGGASFLLPGLGVEAPSKTATMLLAIAILFLGLAINAITQVILKVFVTLLLIAEFTATVVLAIAFFFFDRVHPFSTLFENFNAGEGGASWLWLGWFGAIAIMGWTFLGWEAAGSMGEEVHDPSRNIPKAMIGVVVSIGIITVFVTMASILAIPNIRAAMTGNIADPVIQSVTTHYGTAVERPILIMISLGFIGSLVALHTAGSRTLYALARDGMVPGGRLFTPLSRNRRLPVNALVFTMAVSILILFINIGAEEVFTTLLSIAVAGFFISYAFPVISQAILHGRGRHRAGPFTLGRWSKPVTWIASAWIVFELINVWWPRSPDLPWYQNYGVFMTTVIVAVLGVIAYRFAPRFGGRVGAAPPAEMGEPMTAGGGTTPGMSGTPDE
jgi:amino acid transporter